MKEGEVEGLRWRRGGVNRTHRSGAICAVSRRYDHRVAPARCHRQDIVCLLSNDPVEERALEVRQQGDCVRISVLCIEVRSRTSTIILSCCTTDHSQPPSSFSGLRHGTTVVLLQ